MRIDGKLPWEVLTDRSRRVSEKRGWEDPADFIRAHLDYFLSDYERCLVQSQEVYVELWIEKDALSTVFEQVASPFCLRVVTRRGYNSVTLEADYYRRAEEAIAKGQRPVVLYFGDFDPSGNNMLEASLITLKKEMGLSELKVKRVALTKAQVKRLPPKVGAAKKTDPRYKDYRAKHGTSAWELDALHPRELKQIARKAIYDALDMELFDEEQTLETQDRAKVMEIRREAIQALEDVLYKYKS
jgi:hypothetical protein